MNKLDAVLKVLREDDLCEFGIYGSNPNHEIEQSILAAIRILEAAEKVSEFTDVSVLTLDDFWGVFVKVVKPKIGKGGMYWDRYQRIRALLESLPDDK